MPVYEVQDPDSGKTLELDGDSAPTEHELEGLFAQFHPKPATLAENLFPGRIALQKERDAQGKPVGPFEGAFADVGDVANIPSRALAALFTDQKMSDPNAYLLKGIVDAAPEVTKGSDNPYLGFSQPPGIHPKPVGEFVARTVSDPLSYVGAVKGPINAAQSAAAALNRGSGKLAQELSGVSEEALRLASTKAGRKALEAASGRQAEIGNKLTDAIADYHSYLPEKDVVENALQNMGNVDISKSIQALRDAKVQPRSGILLPHEVKANGEIDNIIQSMRGNSGTKFPKTSLPAPDAYSVRRGLDYSIDFDTPEGKIVNNALKDTRTQLKNDLLTAAGNTGHPEYAGAMKEWSRKLNLLDKIQSRLGLTKNSREAKSQAFVANLFGKNSANKQDLLRELDDVFGTDLLKQSRMTFMADAVGEGGKAALLPRQTTGRATLAAAGGGLAGAAGLGPVGGGSVGGTLAAHASPYVASRVVLPTTQAIENLLKGPLSPRGKALANAFLKTTNATIQARLATQLQKELSQ